MFFSYDSENGFNLHDTAEEARSAATDSISEFLGDDWYEDVNSVCWGVVLETAVEGEHSPCLCGNHDYHCDYHLEPTAAGKSAMIARCSAMCSGA